MVEGGFKLIGVPHLRLLFFFLSLTFCKPLTEPPHAPKCDVKRMRGHLCGCQCQFVWKEREEIREDLKHEWVFPSANLPLR